MSVHEYIDEKHCKDGSDSSNLIFDGFLWHCVIYGVESWSGVLEWSHGVDFGVV